MATRGRGGVLQTVASEAATAAASAAAAAATAAGTAASAAAAAAAEAATAAAKAVATAASAAATAAANASTANDSRIGRLEVEQSKLSADVGLIKLEQQHMREITIGRFTNIDATLASIDNKLDTLKTGSDETRGALTVVRFLGASGLVSGIAALIGVILRLNGVIH